MATVTEAVEQIAVVTGMKPATVAKYARSLREADPPLWSSSGKGGGKAAVHVRAMDLVNLLIGIAGAQPSDAPGAVAALRDIQALSSRTGPLGGWGLNGILPANTPLEVPACTLGERLALLLGQLVELKSADEAAYRQVFVDVALDPGLRAATITSARAPGDGLLIVETYGAPLHGLVEQRLAGLPRVKAVIRRSTAYDQELLKTAAELLADSLARIEPRDLPASPGSEPEENEAPPPCQETAPVTHNSDQPKHHPSRTTLARRQTKGDAGAVQPLRTPPARAKAGQSPKKGPTSQCPS